VRIAFDPAKNRQNKAKHGIDFTLAYELDEDTAAIYRDERADYGEERFIALAPLRGRLHVMVFTRIPERHPCHQPAQGYKREEKAYAQNTLD
jgi:uncharacterized DUF497 family protein